MVRTMEDTRKKYIETMKENEEIKNALQACVDLLEDIRKGLNGPVEPEIIGLYAGHPIIKQIGGWLWDYCERCDSMVGGEPEFREDDCTEFDVTFERGCPIWPGYPPAPHADYDCVNCGKVKPNCECGDDE